MNPASVNHLRALARRCERAQGEKEDCRCRCHGELHGQPHGEAWVQEQILMDRLALLRIPSPQLDWIGYAEFEDRIHAAT